MTIEFDRDNYENEVLQAKGVVMVDFWGPQCRPCLALMPTVEKLEQKYAGKIKVGKVDSSKNRMLCAKLRVIGLPAFLFYKDGEEINRLGGEHLGEADLVKAIDEAIA
ncbi:thioredoxin family protein [Chloroflexota bacterium]